MDTKKSKVDDYENKEQKDCISPVLFWSKLPADGIQNVQLQALASLVSDSEDSGNNSSVAEEEEEEEEEDNDRQGKMEKEQTRVMINSPDVDVVPSNALRMIGGRRHGCSTSARLKRRKAAGPYDMKMRSSSRSSVTRRNTKGEAQVLLSMLQM